MMTKHNILLLGAGFAAVLTAVYVFVTPQKSLESVLPHFSDIQGVPKSTEVKKEKETALDEPPVSTSDIEEVLDTKDHNSRPMVKDALSLDLEQIAGTDPDELLSVDSETSLYDREASLVTRLAASMSQDDIKNLYELRAEPRVRLFDGKLDGGYSEGQKCVTFSEQGSCEAREILSSSGIIIWDGEWAQGYVPTKVGQEVVFVGP